MRASAQDLGLAPCIDASSLAARLAERATAAVRVAPPSRSAVGSPRPHSASRYPHGYVPLLAAPARGMTMISLSLSLSLSVSLGVHNYLYTVCSCCVAWLWVGCRFVYPTCI